MTEFQKRVTEVIHEVVDPELDSIRMLMLDSDNEHEETDAVLSTLSGNVIPLLEETKREVRRIERMVNNQTVPPADDDDSDPEKQEKKLKDLKEWLKKWLNRDPAENPSGNDGGLRELLKRMGPDAPSMGELLLVLAKTLWDFARDMADKMNDLVRFYSFERTLYSKLGVQDGKLDDLLDSVGSVRDQLADCCSDMQDAITEAVKTVNSAIGVVQTQVAELAADVEHSIGAEGSITAEVGRILDAVNGIATTVGSLPESVTVGALLQEILSQTGLLLRDTGECCERMNRKLDTLQSEVSALGPVRTTNQLNTVITRIGSLEASIDDIRRLLQQATGGN